MSFRPFHYVSPKFTQSRFKFVQFVQFAFPAGTLPVGVALGPVGEFRTIYL